MCEFVEVKELNDEQIAYLARCCGDVKTDSWITVTVHLSDEEHDANLAAHSSRVATTHQNKQARLSKAALLVKKAK